jgi:putative CocE/NonD family hydrolase
MPGVASAPEFGIVEEELHVPMRDGVRIGLRIYRPAASGRFPALFAASPYQYRYDDHPAFPIFLWRETGPIRWYVERGYAYVHADVRGSGRSEGVFRFLDKDEQQDACELIAWIARQDWSTGKVGGIGQSYFGFSQWLMATHRPPNLACIAPYDALVDPYRCSGFHGGIYCSYRTWWYTQLRAETLHRAAGDPSGRALDYDLGKALTEHQLYDEWWRERTAYERLDEITIPVFSIGHWGKLGLHLRGNILGYERVAGPKKLLVTGARNAVEAHHLFDTVEFHEAELLPFYDHYLKGLDNGFPGRAPVRLFIRGEQRVRDECEWPLARAEYVPFFLREGRSGSVQSLNDGRLAPEAPTEPRSSTSYAYPDEQWVLGVAAMSDAGPDPVRRVLTFTTDALDRDVEVTGPIVLNLYAASDQPDTDFFVKLSDQEPQAQAGTQPRSSIVSKGWLKASHRRKDVARSTRHRPFYAHDDPCPLTPGEVYLFEIEVLPAAYVFRKGHRIRVELANGDSSVTDSIHVHPYPPYKVGTDTIHHDAARPSHILLPIIPRPHG